MAVYDYNDFKKLVNLQFDKVATVRGRALTKLFATLNLLEALIFHYSVSGNNITSISYRSDKAGYSFLRYLAHSYYKNELLPEEWRINL